MTNDQYQCLECGEQGVNKNSFECPCGTRHNWVIIRPITINNKPVDNRFLWQCDICGENPTGFYNHVPTNQIQCNSHPNPKKKNSNLYHIWRFIGFPSKNRTDWRCKLCKTLPRTINLTGAQSGTPVIRRCPNGKKYCVWERTK